MARYIDADALIKEVIMTEDLSVYNAVVFEGMIKDQPTADVVEVMHGEWVKMDKRGNNVRCSKCGNTLDLRGVNAGRGDANYCPNCGAEMSTQSNAFQRIKSVGERREDEQIH